MFKLLAKLVLKIGGWRIITAADPNFLPKKIFVVAPHTSNWDFFLGLLARSILNLRSNFLMKSSLFKWPFGSIFRAMGGYPVDRGASTNIVEQISDIFDEKERFAIAITPEGTRKRPLKLKTGFYHIARISQIPIIMVKLDYQHKIIEFSEPMYASNDISKDLRKIESYFSGVEGKFPEKSFFYLKLGN